MLHDCINDTKLKQIQKQGINIALQKIQKLDRYTLFWEQIDKSKNGDLLYRDDVINLLISLLKEEY